MCERASLKTFWSALARGPGARAVGGKGGEGDRGGGKMVAVGCEGAGIADGMVVSGVVVQERSIHAAGFGR